MSDFKRLMILVVGMALGCLAYFIIWLFIPARLNTKVTSLEWTHAINLRIREIRHDAEWGQPNNKGFYDEPAFNVSCRSKYYGTEDCNPHPCFCDKKGSCDTCYDQCAEYRDWCNYDYFEWPVSLTQVTSGTDPETYWPKLEAVGVDQRLQRIKEYKVVFQKTDNSDSYEYLAEDLLDFKRFNVGEYWRLRVGKLRTHNIEELERLQAEKE